MITTNEELQALCEKWKPRLGLEDWRIACEFRRGDEFSGDHTYGSCEPHQPTKTAVIAVVYPQTWDPHAASFRRFGETFSTEWLLVHEMLHIVLDVPFDDDPVSDLETQAQEQAIETLTRSLLTAYGSITPRSSLPSAKWVSEGPDYANTGDAYADK